MKRLILIDTPDYSKTDKRAMARDLSEIYWLWNTLLRTSVKKPNLIVAIQKEMFGGHFFFDKMFKIELEPLEPPELVKAYLGHFGSFKPFSEEALSLLARMSRGIFRRFLRYITLSLDLWEGQYRRMSSIIGPEVVKEAVTLERLSEDMELELLPLFPRHSDLRLLAVQLLLMLEEHDPQKQTNLVKQLEIEPFTMSRLLAKLESNGYVTRVRDGTDKVVSLKRQSG
jgi:DNA-binding transcriptional ArsR family regulator